MCAARAELSISVAIVWRGWRRHGDSMEANRRLAVASMDAEDEGDGVSHLKEESTTMVPSWSLVRLTRLEEKLSEGRLKRRPRAHCQGMRCTTST